MRSPSDVDARRPDSGDAAKTPAAHKTEAGKPAALAPVPFMDPKRTYPDWGAAGETHVRDILRSHGYVAGHYVEALERDLAKRVGVAHAIAVDSGTDALWLALRAWFETRPATQREVIVPSFTFVATAGAVVCAGGIPVFADVDPDTYLIDPDSVAGLFTERTAAVIPVHLFGLTADIAALRAAAPGAHILEDAAQAIDATHDLPSRKSAMAGSLGDAATFSFYPSKNLGAAGDGGMVTTDNEPFADTVRALRSHGQMQRGAPSTLVGTNSRMDEMQAAVLGAKLPHLSKWTAQRRQVAARYDEGLSGLSLHTPATPDGRNSAWHLYTVRFASTEQRDAVQASLATQNVASGVYYGTPVHREPCFAPFTPADCPVADRLSATALSLPCFPGLTEVEQDRVIGAVRAALA